MLTKKDFAKIAEILNSEKSQIPEYAYKNLVWKFRTYLEMKNPRFDIDKFEKACMKEE